MAYIKGMGALADIFVHGGLLPLHLHPAQKVKPGCSRGSDWNGAPGAWVKPRTATIMNESCKIICNEILYKRFDFFNVDKALTIVADYKYIKNPTYDLHGGGSRMVFTAAELADCIAIFCKANEIYWDDVNTLKTPAELKAYSDGSFTFATALYNNKCFLSQNIDADGKLIISTKGSKSTRSVGTGTGSTTTGSGGVKDPYKSEGPKSGVARGLVGKPGEKVFAAERFVATLVALVPGKKPRYAFIRPLGASGTESSAGVNKVFIADPSGYRDCQLFFETVREAEAFQTKCKDAGRVPAGAIEFEVRKQYSDANGYFKMNTEFGIALIKASKLNEQLSEEVEVSEDTDPIIAACNNKYGLEEEEKNILETLNDPENFCKDIENQYN
jgi:hypothetical protein